MELNATKDRFFSIIAHDLKNPLGNFKNTTKMLVESYRDFSEIDRFQFLDVMKESSENIYSLLENLLEWARSQIGSIPFNPVDLNLKLLSIEIVKLLKSQAENKHIEIQNHIPLSIMLKADANMLQTIIRNLISNAIKFTRENGKIIISATAKKNNFVVSVSDTGIGISKETTDKLFRIDAEITAPGTNNEKGTGLGLILCKEFIEKHGGKIWADSEVGKGSTFYLTLPNSY